MIRACPRCRTVELNDIEVEDVIIDRCPRCAGLWFDHAEMDQIAGNVTEPRSIDKDTDAVTTGHLKSDMSCPHCRGVVLRRIEAAGPGSRGLVLFRCISCLGSWMDRGQLADQEDPHLGDRLKKLFADSV